MQGVVGVQQEELHEICEDSPHDVPAEVADRGHELRRFIDHPDHHPKVIPLPPSVGIFIGDSCESALELNLSVPASG